MINYKVSLRVILKLSCFQEMLQVDMVKFHSVNAGLLQELN